MEQFPFVLRFQFHACASLISLGLVPETSAIEAHVRPIQFKELAQKACATKLADMPTVFPKVAVRDGTALLHHDDVDDVW